MHRVLSFLKICESKSPGSIMPEKNGFYWQSAEIRLPFHLGLYKLHDWLSKLRESKVAIWVKRNFCSNLKSRILQLLFPSKISASNLLASQSLRLLYVYTLPILSLYVYNKIPFDIFKTFLKSLRVSSLLYASNKSYSQGRCDIEFLIT